MEGMEKVLNIKTEQHWIQTAMKDKEHRIKDHWVTLVGGESLAVLNTGQILLGAGSVTSTPNSPLEELTLWGNVSTLTKALKMGNNTLQ